MTERSPTLAEVIQNFIDANAIEWRTSIPGIIESFDRNTSTCQVRIPILSSFIDDDGESVEETIPPIENVPVSYPGGSAGGFKLTFTWPLEKGDPVTVMFADRSIDKFMDSDGEDVDPVDLRRFDLSDAYVVPLMFGPHSKRPDQPVDEDGFVIGLDNGTQIFIGDQCIGLNSKNAADRASLDSKVQDELARIKGELDQVATLLDAITGVYANPVNEPGNGAPSVFQAALLTATELIPNPDPQNPGSTHSDIVKLD